MGAKAEQALKAVLLLVVAAIVVLTFFLAGPALGVPLGGIAAALLLLHVCRVGAPREDLLSSITNNPAFSDWEGNIFHKEDPPGGFTD